MVKTRNFYFCVILALITVCNFLLSPSAKAQEAGKVGSILIVGNNTIDKAKIMSKVRTRTGDLFNPDTAAEDTKRIGTLDAVEYCYYNTEAVDGDIKLTFVVVEKNLVRSVSFVGNHKVKSKTLRNKLSFAIGDYLDAVLAQTGKEAIKEFYLKKGYAFAEVEYDSTRLQKGEVVYSINEGPRTKIAGIKFSGNKALKSGELKKAVKTKKKKFLLLKQYYNEEKAEKDLIKLQQIYYDQGYLDAKIQLKREFNADKSKVRLTFVIEEGPLYRIERIIIKGNQHFDSEQLYGRIKSQQQQVYSEKKADSDERKLLSLYHENGFIYAEVEQIQRFISENRVEIEFDITEGQRYRIGEISITGNQQTQDKVVRRVLDEYDFQPGKWYNSDTARGDGTGYLEKLIGRTVFSETGTSTIKPSGDAPDQRDAQVRVVEGQSGMVMLGAGVASDSGAIGQLVFEQKNFNISDWPDSMGEFITGKAFKGAGQQFRIALQPGTEVSEYSISFTEPYLYDKPLSLDVIGSSYERGRESFDEQRTKGYIGLEKRYKNKWRRRIGFRAENVDVGSIDFDAPQEIRDIKGNNSLFGVKFGAGKEIIDDRFNPSKGYTLNFDYEQVAGDHTFGVLSATHRWYHTLREDLAERKTILATKLHAATTLGDAPSFEKFYAGGSGFYGIRGFDYRGVSTRGLQTNVLNPERKDPIGSDWIFLANAETIVPLFSENFAAIFFLDSGAIDTGTYRSAIGTGIQILLPQWFGPVPMRFELAAPITKDDDDDTQVFSFSIGRLF